MTSQVHELENLILLKCSLLLEAIKKKKKKKESNLQFQCYSQTPEDIFYRNRKNPEIYIRNNKRSSGL